MYASKINIEVIWKPKIFFVTWEKITIMILLAQYLLAGVTIALLLEVFIRWAGEEVSHMERISLIVGWPIMLLVFIYNFIKGIFE